MKLDKLNQEILKCVFCKRRAKGKLVPGEGNASAKIVFVGEAPGKEEILTGRPFVGRAGKLLREFIGVAGLRPEDTFITSAIKYLPKTYITPKATDIVHGRLHLNAQLDIIKPKIIVLLGNTATLSLLDEKLSMSKVHGTVIKRNALKYFISYHPAAALYLPKLRQIISKDFLKIKKLINS